MTSELSAPRPSQSRTAPAEQKVVLGAQTRSLQRWSTQRRPVPHSPSSRHVVVAFGLRQVGAAPGAPGVQTSGNVQSVTRLPRTPHELNWYTSPLEQPCDAFGVQVQLAVVDVAVQTAPFAHVVTSS